MKLSSEYHSAKAPNLLKVASRDKSRPVLTCVYLDVDRGVLEATDSYCLASVPVGVEPGDRSGLIAAEALAALAKAQRAHRAVTLSLACGETETTLTTPDGDSSSWPRPSGQWPNFPQLIPDEANRSAFRVKLSAAKLSAVAEALGTDAVTLSFVRATEPEESPETGYFPQALRPILVHNGGHGETGLVMPIRIG